jgi:hypothetical protein
MSGNPGHIEAQLRGLVERIKVLEKEVRQKDRIIGNLVSTQAPPTASRR